MPPPRLSDIESAGLQRIEKMLHAHDGYRRECLNLIASENITSPAVARLSHNDLSHRYADYKGIDPGARKYLGNRHIVPLEQHVLELSRHLFHADHADLRPLSGHVAGEAVLLGLCRPGDTVLELDSVAGGHRLAEKLAVAALIDLRVLPLPFDAETYNLDIRRCGELILRERPRVVILGSSSFLFPHPVADIRGFVDQLEDCTLLYDASHVLGLIAGGRFQKPLEEGAHVVTASTHKTFGGPQGGLLLTNDLKLAQRIGEAIYPALVTNHHLHRIPAFGAACLEWSRFGEAHADAVVRNAQALAAAIIQEGLDVVGHAGVHTQSHTVLLATRAFGRSSEQAHRLEEAGIIVGPTTLPERWGRGGLRLGVQELTRRGMTPEDAGPIARLIGDLLKEKRSSDACRSEVRALAGRLDACLFALE